MIETLKPCPFCGEPAARVTEAGIIECGHCCSTSPCDPYRETCWDTRPIEDALRARAEAAEADAAAWRGFAESVAVAVHAGETGEIIANHLTPDDLPDLLGAVSRMERERDALRAQLAKCHVQMDAMESTISERLPERVGLRDDVARLLREDVARLRGNADALRARAERVERERDVALGEVARLLAVIDDAAADLPANHNGAYLSPLEVRADAVRLRLIAALGGDR